MNLLSWAVSFMLWAPREAMTVKTGSQLLDTRRSFGRLRFELRDRDPSRE